MNRACWSLSFLVLFLTLSLFATALAATITVSPGGPLTIQEAIDQAEDGDVVELLDGIYCGDGNRDLEFLGKAITVCSQNGDPLACVIDVEGSDGDLHRAFHIRSAEGSDTVVDGLTLRNGYHSWSGGILSETYCTPTIRNCRFIANQGTEGGGLCAKDAAIIENCWFEDNYSTSHGGGASAAGNLGYASTFTGCTFVNNTAGTYGGGFRC